MSKYHEQVHCAAADIDLAFWRRPRGVTVPDDELSFLLVPDAVEARAVAAVAAQVQQYQHDQQRAQSPPINAALMATMGGLLPGVLLHDHLFHGRRADQPAIAFGTVDISLYSGPDARRSQPVVAQPVSIDVSGRVVLVIDDLGDSGDTLLHLREHIAGLGAARVLTLALYMKPQAMATCPVDFHFGEVAQDTWIITPREAVETLVKRVPLWRERGANESECRRRLVELIGYPPALVEQYLPALFA